MQAKIDQSSNPENLEELIQELYGFFSDLYHVVQTRRDAEAVAGENISSYNRHLLPILDDLNKGIAPLLATTPEEAKPEHARKFIAAILKLLEFFQQKGQVKPEVQAQLRKLGYQEVKRFAETYQRPDQWLTWLSASGALTSAIAGNLLNTTIFSLTATLYHQSGELDKAILSDVDRVAEQQGPLMKRILKGSTLNSGQIASIMQNVRTMALSVLIALGVTNSALHLTENHPPVDVTTMMPVSAEHAKDIRKMVEQITTAHLFLILCLLVYAVLERFSDGLRVRDKTAFATYLERMLEMVKYTPLQLRGFRQLALELDAAVKRMEKDPQYDPFPLAKKILETLKEIDQGKSVHVRDILTKAKMAIREGREDKKAAGKEVPGELSGKVQQSRKQVWAIAPFTLNPPRKDGLTRAERKALHAMQKAAARPVKDETPKMTISSATAMGPVSAPAEVVKTLDGREEKIRAVTFPIMLDLSTFQEFLRAMKFKAESKRGKGSHTMYFLENDRATLAVNTSQDYGRYDDAKIKADLLRKPPYLSPEWVYWHYCRHFGYVEAVKQYKKFFGKEFNKNNEPPQFDDEVT